MLSPTRFPALPSKLLLGAVETVPGLVTGFQVSVKAWGRDIFVVPGIASRAYLSPKSFVGRHQPRATSPAPSARG